MNEFDAVIIGAGAIGSSVAYHLKLKAPKERVLLLDMKSAPGQGNTAKSAGCFRDFWSSKTNYLLADASIDFFIHLQFELGYNVGLEMIGYLFLLSEKQYRGIKGVLHSLRKNGIIFKVFEKDDLKKRMNLNCELKEDQEAGFMGLEEVGTGIFAPKAGYLNPDDLVNFYVEQFQKLGGETLFNCKALKLIVEPENKLNIPWEPLPWQEVKIKGVKTTKGKFRSRKVVVATGVWSNQILDPAGIDSLIKPKKRQIFVVRADKKELRKLLFTKGFNERGALPFTILPRPQIYIKPMIKDETFWIGCSDEIGREFKLEDEPKPESKFYEYGVYPALVKYFPQFKDQRPMNMWAGQYDINSFDGCPIAFSESNLIFIAGCSRGVMLSDSMGRIAASIYLEQREAELFNGEKIKVDHLGVLNRKMEKESVII